MVQENLVVGARDGFYLSSSQGYTSIRCEQHTVYQLPRLNEIQDSLVRSVFGPGLEVPDFNSVDSSLNSCLKSLFTQISDVLSISIRSNGSILASFDSSYDTPLPSMHNLDPHLAYRLTRFTLFRPNGNGMTIESALSKFSGSIFDTDLSAALLRLDGTSSLEKLLAVFPRNIQNTLSVSLTFLVAAGFVEVGSFTDGSTSFPSDKDEVLRQWEFHDLLFHSRSREGRSVNSHGAKFSFIDTVEPLPALKATPPGTRIFLPEPEEWSSSAASASLLDTITKRRSIRDTSATPMSISRLSEFLHHTISASNVGTPISLEGNSYEVVRRNFPGGGAVYELEFYITVNRCDGLERGSYFYDPKNHLLIHLDTSISFSDRLLSRAMSSAELTQFPDVLITMTSRFQRVSWKYESISYSLTLKNVGVVFQSMYLVATAMNLAPCALGVGNSDLSTQAFGTNYLEESSVGEFILGESI